MSPVFLRWNTGSLLERCTNFPSSHSRLKHRQGEHHCQVVAVASRRLAASSRSSADFTLPLPLISPSSSAKHNTAFGTLTLARLSLQKVRTAAAVTVPDSPR